MNLARYLPFSLAYLCPLLLWAQCLPTGAKVCVSGDDTTQVWVNGYYLGSKNYCDLRSGCTPENLCFSLPLQDIPGPQICLAVETANVNPVKVFSSWDLEVDCAGAKPFVITDENPEKSSVSLYWDPTGGSSCGVGSSPPVDARGNVWTDLNYNPASNPFTLTGVQVTAETYTCAQLTDPLTGFVLHYISYDDQAQGSGPTKACGILYWRQIAHLPVFIPTSTPTPIFTPTRVFTPTLVPTGTFTWTPTPFPPSPTPTSRPRPRATYTPLPALRPVRALPTPHRIRIRPTPTFIWHPTATWTPLPPRVWLPIPTPTSPKPTPLPAWLPPLEKSQVIVFQTPPVEIYVTFKDGAGRYQVEVVDGRGRPLQVLFDKQIVGEGESWITWDGKDSQGQDTGSGQYFAIFFKDGRPLRSISIYRSRKTTP